MLSKEILREYFEYVSDGTLLRKKNTRNAKAGQIASGFLHRNGYKTFSFKNKTYWLHRVIYTWHFGTLPGMLDHINGDRADNRIENLRPATRSENACNSKLFRSNTTGVKGLYFCKRSKCWFGVIGANGKIVRTSYSKDKNHTIKILTEAREALHGKFARHK